MSESPIVGVGQSQMMVPPGITVHTVLHFREDGTVTWQYRTKADKEKAERG